MWDFFHNVGAIVSITTVIHLVVVTLTIIWILSIKRDSTAAMAWCLTAILLPFLGAFLFWVFGYQRVYRPLLRKKKHKKLFRQQHPRRRPSSAKRFGHGWAGMARLAQRLDAFPATIGNEVVFFHEGQSAFDAKLEAIRGAQQHVHLEYFIVQPDDTGRTLLSLLCEKVRQGVEVRLLYDAMGSHRLKRQTVAELRQAGGRCGAFFPLFDPLRRRTQINLRNHRKIVVVDGQVGFSGGMNIGDEYLSKSKSFGFWRDTHMRLTGPAVADLQRVFVEDWHFASGEMLKGKRYFPDNSKIGESPVQVVMSGPDQELKSIREVYFAAILRARRRLWIATPYFVPDAGIHDALCLAARSGIDVRLLGLYHPDKWLPFLAGRYYWTDMLAAGVKIYQYSKGMMHSKLMMVDGRWASCGTANLDNRSLHLNFEVNCLLYDPAHVAVLEAAFLRDLETAIALDAATYAKRPIVYRAAENVCRLFSPIL